VDITREGVWKNPVLMKILSQQPVETEEGKQEALAMRWSCYEVTQCTFIGETMI